MIIHLKIYAQHKYMDNFANFDRSTFPKICVKFNKNIKSYDDYRNFEKEWLRCYIENKNFYFVFDTSNVGYVNPLYGYNLTNFIQQIKSLKFDLLQFSIIIVDNWYIKQLLFWVFQIQSPVADVYIVEKNINTDVLIDDIQNNKLIKDENIYIIYKDNS